MPDLSAKLAIVTGATGGLGSEIAKSLAHAGARVCVADLDAGRCEQVAGEIGAGAFGCAVDIACPSSVEALFDRVEASAGVPHILVNCAGVFGMQALIDIEIAEFDRIFDVNVRGLILMTQAAARRMIAAGSPGTMVNIASDAGRHGMAGATVYCASKAAVISITQSTAVELARHGIRVNAIAPGSISTPMWTIVERQLPAFAPIPDGVTAAEAVAAAVPAGRMSDPADYVGAVLYLVSDASAYVIGQTLNVDGGLILN